MKLSVVAFLGLILFASVGCTMNAKQGQDPGACQSGESNCPGHSAVEPDYGGRGNGAHASGGGGGMGMGM